MNETQPTSPEDGIPSLEPVAEESLVEECFVEEFLEPQEVNETLNESEVEGRKSKKRKANPKENPIDERINSILDQVEDLVSFPQGARGGRHDPFAHYLTSRLEMLPLNVARELEVEFTCRVNSILDSQIEQN